MAFAIDASKPFGLPRVIIAAARQVSRRAAGSSASILDHVALDHVVLDHVALDHVVLDHVALDRRACVQRRVGTDHDPLVIKLLLEEVE